MIPEKTLEIIRAEAEKKYPAGNAHNHMLANGAFRKIWGEGAKRGYELASEEISRLKKENEAYRSLVLEEAEYLYKKGKINAAQIGAARLNYKPKP